MGIDRKEMFEKSRGWKDAGGEMKEWEGRVAEKKNREGAPFHGNPRK